MAKNAPNSLSSGAPPRLRWGSLQRSQNSRAVFKGPTSKGKERNVTGGKRERKGREGKRR